MISFAKEFRSGGCREADFGPTSSFWIIVHPSREENQLTILIACPISVYVFSKKSLALKAIRNLTEGKKRKTARLFKFSSRQEMINSLKNIGVKCILIDFPGFSHNPCDYCFPLYPHETCFDFCSFKKKPHWKTRRLPFFIGSFFKNKIDIGIYWI